MKFYPASRRSEHAWAGLDTFDLDLADRAGEARPVAQALDDPAAQDYPPALRLLQDTALGLYKARPALRDASEIAPSSRLNRAVLEEVAGEARWEEMRVRTRLDEAMSILGAATLAGRLFEVLTEEQKQQIREAADAEREARRQEALAAALADGAKQGNAHPDVEARIQAALNAAQKARQRAERAADRAVEGLDEGARRRLRMAARQAAQDLKERGEEMAGWGLSAGVGSRVPPEERLALARAIAESKKLRRIARLAGRLRNLALAAQAEKVKSGVGEVYGVELGRHLGRLLASEAVRLRHPVLKKDFLRRFGLGQLLQYRLRGREKAGLGPLVVVWDESGSMMGEKEVWAKAVALALLAVAQRQKRPWAGVAFSAGGQVRSVVFEAPHQQVRPGDLVDLAQHFFCGGTDFQLALGTARDIIGEQQRFQRADVVFVTDGIARVSDEWLDDLVGWKRRTGTRIFSVLVDLGASAEEEVRRWSDRVERMLDFARDVRGREGLAREVFRGV
ncbi:MAG TPA: hypothetical protein EYH30_10710 [Anaerolineales bacterium]|nr:hypothetical protein [Anaerolineales bacterium]